MISSSSGGGGGFSVVVAIIVVFLFLFLIFMLKHSDSTKLVYFLSYVKWSVNKFRSNLKHTKYKWAHRGKG